MFAQPWSRICANHHRTILNTRAARRVQQRTDVAAWLDWQHHQPTMRSFQHLRKAERARAAELLRAIDQTMANPRYPAGLKAAWLMRHQTELERLVQRAIDAALRHFLRSHSFFGPKWLKTKGPMPTDEP